MLALVRAQRPLVHNITNLVTMSLVAGAELAVGGRSPVMSADPSEASEAAAACDALLLNLGTLTPAWVPSMLHAARVARARGRPVVLDPVAVGGSTLRRTVADTLLGSDLVTAVKGNASEMVCLGGGPALPGTAAQDGLDGAAYTYQVARRCGIIAICTGAIDLVTDGEHTFEVHNGSPLQARAVGTGCLAGGLLAVFLAVEASLVGAACALAVAGLAAQEAAARSAGPGSLLPAMLDALHAMQPEAASLGARINPVR